MRNLLKLLCLLVMFAAPAWADCQSAAPQAWGAGVSCIWGNSNAGTSAVVGTSNQLTHTFTSGNESVVFGYYCLTNSNVCAQPSDWQANHNYANGTIILPTSATFNPCGFGVVATSGGTQTSGGSEPTFSTGSPCPTTTSTVSDGGVTWTLIKLTVQDQTGTAISCFNFSNSSPQGPQVTTPGAASTLQQWGAYCANLPSGITGIKVGCGNNAYCVFVSVFAYEITGGCTAGASCIVTDSQHAASSVTSVTLTTSNTTLTNELMVSLFGNQNDEVFNGPTNGCLQADQNFGANQVVIKAIGPANVTPTCTSSWTPSDTGGGTSMLLKTAVSATPSAGGGGGGNALLTLHAGSGGKAPSVQNGHLARSFNGTNTDSMHSAAALILGAPNVISIGFRGYNTTNGSADALFMESTTNYNNTRGAILVDPNSGSHPGNFEFAANTVSGAGGILDCTFAQPSQATWHTYLLVMDISSASGNCKAYVDGVSQSVTITHGGSEVATTFTDQTWYFMSRNDTSLNNNGRMTDIAIWQGDESANAATLNSCTTDTSAVDNPNQLYYWQIQQVSPETPTTGTFNLTIRGTANIAGPC